MRYLAYWRRHRPLAGAVVVTIALAIATATAVYSVVEAVVLRALPMRDPERLVWMWNARVERDRAPFSALDLRDYREQNHVLDGLAPFINWTANLTGVGDAERLEGVRVDPAFFDLLGVRATRGRTLSAGDRHAQVAVLTERLWRRRFGSDGDIVGHAVSLNGTAYTIVGVLPAAFVFPFRDAEIAIPLSIENDPRRTDRGAGFLRVVARLKPGVSLPAAKADLDAIGVRLRHDYPDDDAKKLGVNLYALDREIVGDARVLLQTLFGAVTLLLVVACTNIANLLLVGLAGRRRELGLRVALGATRLQIASHLLGEIGMLVVPAGIAGLFAGRGFARGLVAWGGTALPRLDDIGLTTGVVAFALLSTAGAALVCGAIPAWLLSDVPAIGLASAGRTSSDAGAHGTLRRGFVAVQLAAAVVLLVAMFATLHQFNQLQAVDPGFDGRHVLSAQLALLPTKYFKPADITIFADTLRRDLRSIPGVADAAAISLLPLSGLLSTQDYRIAGKTEPPPDEIPQAHYRIATSGYFRIMGIQVRGREFNETDRESTRRVAVVSRTLAERHWPDALPIGDHLIVGGESLEVIGVCEDVKQFSLETGHTADLYVPLRQMPPGQAQFVAARMYWVVAAVGDPMAIADAVRARVRHLDKDVATTSTRPMRNVLTASMGSRRFSADLITIAGAAAFALALIGVYSVTAFSIAHRTREIAIRLSLGAVPSQVIRSVVGAEAKSIGAGLIAGALGSLFISRVWSMLVSSGGVVEPRVIAAAVAILGASATAASYLPARRVVRTDPVAALRPE